MHGEFVGVWDETYREIWAPALQTEGVPADVYSQLYSEAFDRFRRTTDVSGFGLDLLRDDEFLRQAFLFAVRATGAETDLDYANRLFADSGLVDTEQPIERRVGALNLLAQFEGDELLTKRAFSSATSELINNEEMCKEAAHRILSTITNDTIKSREAFESIKGSHFISERSVLGFLESSFDLLMDLGGEGLSRRYFELLLQFIEKFNLRYDLRPPCTICPTLPGLFTSLIRDLRAATTRDRHLEGLREDFEGALRDLRIDCSSARIRNCIQKQIVLLEAIGQSNPRVKSNTFGQICEQLATWPHSKVQEAAQNLYKFTNSYPGIRHAGSPETALREVDMRDLVAISVALAGFIPYLSAEISADLVYMGT